MFSGTWTALVTPFTSTGDAIDGDTLERLVELQIQGGVSGLVPCGTTGETPTLTESEQTEVITRTVAVTRGRVPIFAGVGSSSTRTTIAAAQRALAAGADGIMVVMPYYSRPCQEGLLQHVIAVAREVAAPVMLYNVPARTQVDLLAETTVRICEAASNVVAMKDATGNVLRCQELNRHLAGRLTILCGDDALTLAMMAVGAQGVVSVTSNLYPQLVAQVVHLAQQGSWDEAKRLHFQLLPVHEAMFCAPSPGPVKAALAWKHAFSAAMRLPLVAPSPTVNAQIQQTIQEFESAS